MRRFVTFIAAVALLAAIAAAPASAGGSGGGGGGGDPTLSPTDEKNAPRSQDYHDTLNAAIVDIQDFWADEFPSVYGGKYHRIPNSRIFAAHPGIKLPRCQGQKLTYADTEGNAFYCYKSNFVAYDDVGLFPQLFRDYGAFSIALVLAHEWGHAIQDRSNNSDQPVIFKELQADCFAGSWVQRVDNGDSNKGVELKDGNLDAGLAAFLAFRDTPGSAPDDSSAHGAGFDRVSAFQQGFEDGATTCATYFDSPPALTEAPFTTAEEAASGGNVDADRVVPVMVDLLNDYYTQVEPAYVPKTIDDVASYDSGGSKDQLPSCGGSTPAVSELESRVFYCLDDGYFAFDEPYVQHVYDDIGDFGVGTLLANTWATYVQSLESFPGVQTNADNAVLGADCYTGSFAKAMNEELVSSDELDSSGQSTPIVLSPGDLDETISAFIDYAAARGLGKDLDVTFVRVQAFRDGFLNGFQTCQTNYANTDVTIG